MRVLLLCDDRYHPGDIPAEGLAPLKEKSFTFDVISNAKDFCPSVLSDYSVVIVSKCDHTTLEDWTSWKTDEIQDAFIRYVENGGGLLVTHSGTVKGENTQKLDMFIGSYFAFHPNNCPVAVYAVKPHPIIAEGFTTFEEVDEHYYLTITAKDADVFLVSYAAAQGDAAKYESEPYFNTPAAANAAGYTRLQGKGRVCVLTPGHTLEVWLNPHYQALLENTLRWCAGI
jgi:type 1 glutamine amidotransferase